MAKNPNVAGNRKIFSKRVLTEFEAREVRIRYRFQQFFLSFYRAEPIKLHELVSVTSSNLFIAQTLWLGLDTLVTPSIILQLKVLKDYLGVKSFRNLDSKIN